MVQPDYRYQAGVAIGCEGPDAGLVRTGRLGVRRSRDGARLEHFLADARHWREAFKHNNEGGRDERPSGVDPFVVLLENPSRAAVVDAMAECGAFLHAFRDRPDWSGGSFHFSFAGHGTDAGDLVLADGALSPDELAELVTASVDPNPPAKRRLGLVLDSCFSGLTLARIMLHPLRRSQLLITDGFAAAMHDELAWELDALGHGALTFTMANRRNAHVDRDRLAKAVEQGDETYLRLALQGFVPNPVSYLTDADQHSLDLLNGHWLEIKGLGVVDVLGNVSLCQLIDALERVRRGPQPGLGNKIELRG